MSNDFYIFGAVAPITEGPLLVIRCMGALITHNQISYFFFSPLYEVDEDSIISMESGIGVSIFPTVSNRIEICRSILSSSGVSIIAQETTLEQILGFRADASVAPQFSIGNESGSCKMTASLILSETNARAQIDCQSGGAISIKFQGND